jgi:uncharacterized membrane protein
VPPIRSAGSVASGVGDTGEHMGGRTMWGRLRALLQRVDGPQSPVRMLLRFALAAFLAFAGVGHFVDPEQFLAQVPPYLPAPELLVLVSGVVELGLAAALVLLPRRRAAVGVVVLLFFLAVLPGNIAQYTEGRDAFGLDTDMARLVRVLLSPLLWVWALAATDVWPRPRHLRS